MARMARGRMMSVENQEMSVFEWRNRPDGNLQMVFAKKPGVPDVIITIPNNDILVLFAKTLLANHKETFIHWEHLQAFKNLGHCNMKSKIETQNIVPPNECYKSVITEG